MVDFEIRLRRYNIERRQVTGSGTEQDPLIGGFLPLEVYNNVAGSWHYGNWRASSQKWPHIKLDQLDHQQGRFPIFDPPDDAGTAEKVTVRCDATGTDFTGQQRTEPLRAEFWIVTDYKVEDGDVKWKRQTAIEEIKAAVAALERLQS